MTFSRRPLSVAAKGGRMMRLLNLAALLALAAPAAAQPPAAQAPAAAPALDAAAEQALVERAVTLIDAKKPVEAIALLDQVLAAEEKAHQGEGRQIYAA